MPEHVITLHGCDASTTVTVELADREAELLRQVAARTRAASEFSCEPWMTIDGIGEDHHA